jgi:hypothetical protein
MVVVSFASGDRGTQPGRGRHEGQPLIWTFYTIPGPAAGHETWPKNNDA